MIVQYIEKEYPGAGSTDSVTEQPLPGVAPKIE
jgi:hypothetical protein